MVTLCISLYWFKTQGKRMIEHFKQRENETEKKKIEYHFCRWSFWLVLLLVFLFFFFVLYVLLWVVVLGKAIGCYPCTKVFQVYLPEVAQT